MTVRKWGQDQLVNKVFTGSQRQPTVGALTDGGYVVAWTDESVTNGVVRVQRFDAAGVASGAEVTLTGAAGASSPNLTSLANGGFSLAYIGRYSSSDSDPTVATFGPAGTFVNDTSLSTLVDRVSQIRSDRNGTGVVAVWRNDDLNGGDIVAGRITAAGALTGSPVALNSSTLGSQFQPDVAQLTNGHLAVVYGSAGIIYARTFDASLGSPTAEVAITVASFYEQPRVSALSNGGFVVVYGTEPGFPENSSGVRAQLFTPAGVRYGGAIELNSTYPGSQEYPEIVATPNGGFAAVWFDGFIVRGRVFEASGAPIDREFTVSTGAITGLSSDGLSVAALSDGRLVVTWAGDIADADLSGYSVHSQIIDPRDGQVSGTGSADTMYGHELVADQIEGFGGDDRLFGLGGGDAIYGGDGADTLDGGRGDDLLVGGNGDDALIGGDGADTLIGELGVDQMNGGAGDDLIYFDASDDLPNVLGGGGRDTLVVMDMAAPIAFDLAAHEFEAAIVTTHDLAGNQSFAQYDDIYAPGWVRTDQVLLLDDGSRAITHYDAYNAESYTSFTDYYNAGMVRTAQNVINDGNSRTLQIFDSAHSQSYTSYVDAFNAAGQLTSRQAFNDDGTRSTYVPDFAGNQFYTSYSVFFDAANRQVRQSTSLDSGNRLEQTFDAANTQTFTSYVDEYNTANVNIHKTVYYDDGSVVLLF